MNLPSDQIWLWAERLSVLLAGFASLIAVILGARALSLARSDQRQRKRGQAAIVLNVADLIRRRMGGMWRGRIGDSVSWPSGSELDSMLQEIEQDVSFAGTMQDRAATIDLKAVSYAELVWQRAWEIRWGLASAKRAWSNYVEGRESLPRPVEQQWHRHRLRILENVEATLATLDLLEALFDEPMRFINGEPRGDHVKRVDEDIRRLATVRALEYTQRIDRELGAAVESVD